MLFSTGSLRAGVIRPVPGREAHWQIGEAGSYGKVYTLPVKRGYVHEGSTYEDSSAMYDHFGVDKHGRPIEDAPEQEGS